MSWLIIALSLAAGIALGYRLPAVRGWWQHYRARHRFKPAMLRAYRSAPSARSDSEAPKP